MDTRLLILLLFLLAFIEQAEFKKKHEHDKQKHEKHGRGEHERGGGKHKEDLVRDHDIAEDPSEDDDEHDGSWLFDLQDLNGPCDPNPCFNKGRCEERKKGKFKCDCPDHFRGRRCEKGKRVCKKNTCGDGICVLTSDPPFYECKCKEPFKPPKCHATAPCEPSPCQNGGKCIKQGRDFKCECPEGYSGKFCQVGPHDCYEDDGESYRGKVSETKDHDECLYWNAYFLLQNGVNPFKAYDDVDGLGPHNFCRNPDGDVKPWCFIKRGRHLRWEHCDVRKCPDTVRPPPITARPVTQDPKPTYIPTKPTAEQVKPTQPTTQPVKTTEPVKPTMHTCEVLGFPCATEPVKTTEPVTEATATVTIAPVPVKQFATCGKPEPRRKLYRIYGGMKAIPGTHPWQASLQVRTKGTMLAFRHTCGAALIQSCWVLTAAHCINKNNDMRVVFGVLDLGKKEIFEQIVAVETATVHEGYKETASAVYNDIALLKLKSTDGICIKESQYVKTLCLPNTTFPDGTECSIAGWGATPELEHGSSQLMDAEVLLISQVRCSDTSVYGKILDDSMFCAGYLEGGIDSCQGDSGGPLTCVKQGTHYLYGLVSWGDSCGKANKPGVYTNVIKFIDWIISKIGGKI